MPDESYILRISRDDNERQLYTMHSLYVGIRREWSYGTKVLFIRKFLNNDAFIGSGVIDKIVILDELTEKEKKLCIENNWYGKLLFKMVARFRPAVLIKDTPVADTNPLVLHGTIISTANFLAIEKLVHARIIS
jgi:hypothetical protein